MACATAGLACVAAWRLWDPIERQALFVGLAFPHFCLAMNLIEAYRLDATPILHVGTIAYITNGILLI